MNTTKTLARRPVLFALLVILLLSAPIATLELTNVTHFFHRQQATFPTTPTSGGGSANNQKGETNTTPNQSNSSAQPGDNKSDTGGTANATLVAPTGDFVSSHIVHVDSQIASVCNTTPGAKCQILFTMDATTISLAPQSTDRAGSTYWASWTPRGIGLSEGSWQITASATLDGKTVTSSDGKEFVVSQ